MAMGRRRDCQPGDTKPQPVLGGYFKITVIERAVIVFVSPS